MIFGRPALRIAPVFIETPLRFDDVAALVANKSQEGPVRFRFNDTDVIVAKDTAEEDIRPLYEAYKGVEDVDAPMLRYNPEGNLRISDITENVALLSQASGMYVQFKCNEVEVTATPNSVAKDVNDAYQDKLNKSGRLTWLMLDY